MVTSSRYDISGRLICAGHIISDENGCRATVFYYHHRFRVALTEQDLKNGSNCSLGLFIIGGVKIEDNATENVPDQ